MGKINVMILGWEKYYTETSFLPNFSKHGSSFCSIYISVFFAPQNIWTQNEREMGLNTGIAT